ncbi:hypothetical protein C1924_12130 [Stenotrophomonas sp. ESTM1D_MKCIP4_1]|uniref:hypothetical protein n=1 Tax=Stenotrophomonas sp. ESTM1D_MKCIP4_1 TaxID=2072414 RepID=UPI000D53D011|nr:hypothetical protein [Stenotrophomonas sp. ESTM1D_MKCIP4_1]AWH53868.1 hypothetical protein C1924_12130 [Stenotrophomonas sp. ESTM1D_MKCIP4_1]
MAAVSITLVETVARAVFKRSPVLVTELYSSPGSQPRRYDSAEALCEHGRALQWVSGGVLLVGVQYADMGGAVRVRPFDAGRGEAARLTVSGWGLISIRLPMAVDANFAASVHALTERAALARERGALEVPPVCDWNWNAVESHKRRLKDVLRKAL